MTLDLDRALEVTKKAAAAAATVSLSHYERGVDIETKPDRSPVTIADRESEAAILEEIRGAFPDHGIVAEESGIQEGSAPYRWIVDPIDGTRGFTRGGKFWGALIALEGDGEILTGAMVMPALDETYWAAKGKGCFLNGDRLQVSKINSWADATLSVGELGPLLRSAYAQRLANMMRTAASVRCYGDLAGAAMVLQGKAELWVEGGVKAWDIAPTRILVEEAGGRFTDFEGAPTVHSGNAIASNGLLHDHALGGMSIE